MNTRVVGPVIDVVNFYVVHPLVKTTDACIRVRAVVPSYGNISNTRTDTGPRRNRLQFQ